MAKRKKPFFKVLLGLFFVAGLVLLGYAGVAKWVFVLNAGSEKLSIIDPKKDLVVGECETGPNAHLASLTPDLKKIYTGENNGDSVTVIDAVNGRTLKRIKTGKSPKHPIVSPDGRYVLVNHTKELKAVLIDTKTDEIVATFSAEVENKDYKGPIMMHSAFTWDGKYAFVQNYADRKSYVLRIPSLEVVATIEGDSPAHYFVPTPDNKEVWIVYEGDNAKRIKPSVEILDMKTFTVTKKIEIPVGEDEPIEGHHGIFTLDGKYFFFCNRGPAPKFGGTTVAVIDTAKKEVIRTIKAANGVGHPYLTPDGKYVVLTPYGSNVITIVDAKSALKLADVPVGTGNGARHVAFTADGKKAYITNTPDGAVYVLDMRTFQVVKAIETGKNAAQVINTYTNLFEIPGTYADFQKHEKPKK